MNYSYSFPEKTIIKKDLHPCCSIYRHSLTPPTDSLTLSGFSLKPVFFLAASLLKKEAFPYKT